MDTHKVLTPCPKHIFYGILDCLQGSQVQFSKQKVFKGYFHQKGLLKHFTLKEKSVLHVQFLNAKHCFQYLKYKNRHNVSYNIRK